MKIVLNNRSERFSEKSLTLTEVIAKKNFTFKMLVTKVNNKLIKTEERDSTIVSDGDNVTILHLVSGG